MRPLQHLNWVTVLVVVVLGTAVFLAGHSIYTRSTLSGPLHSYYEAHPAVRSAEIELESGQWKVTLEIDRVDRWPDVYRDLHAGSQRLLGDRAFYLDVVDERDSQLEAAYHALHFHLHEALATGNFTVLAGLERDAGPAVRLEVDGDRLYVQLETGDAYLYDVLDRPRGGDPPW